MNEFISRFQIVAEIGCNHEGDFKKAMELTHLAADAGADIVKFQSFTPERYVAADNKERQKQITNFALTKKNFIELKHIADQRKIGFMSTPVTEDWVVFLKSLCCAIKIASGDMTFEPVIKAAAKTGKHLILSTGASTLEEIDQAIAWIQEEIGQEKISDYLTLMHCVSSYPTPIEEANILAIPFLREKYNLNVGYSNHVIGMSACLAAVALGATLIEVHFTDKKEGRVFRDHSLSFDFNDLKNFVHLAKEIRKSLGKYDKKVQPSESTNISLIRKGIVAAQDIKAGDTLTQDKLMFARPASEFSANDLSQLIGKKVNRDIMRGYLISKDAVACVE